jgi:hypothetical protein
MAPCVGLHIRHGDAKNDLRRLSTLDRGLDAHATCARDFAASLGVTSIYLASDNASMFTLGPLKYPQLGWYGQRRSIRDYVGHVPSFEGYHSEKSMEQEMANMLVGTQPASMHAYYQSVIIIIALYTSLCYFT